MASLAKAEPETKENWYVLGTDNPKLLQVVQYYARKYKIKIGNQEKRWNNTLLGEKNPSWPTVYSIQTSFQEARNLQSTFENTKASELRAMLWSNYETAPFISKELVQLMSEILFDTLTGAIANGDTEKAGVVAKQLAERFPNTKADRNRHPPPTFDAIKKFSNLKQLASGTIKISTDQPGNLWADGINFGPISGQRQISLGIGTHKLWVETSSQRAFSRKVVIREKENPPIHFNPNFHHCFDTQKPFLTNCSTLDFRQTLKEKLQLRSLLFAHWITETGPQKAIEIIEMGPINDKTAIVRQTITSPIQRAESNFEPLIEFQDNKNFDPRWLLPLGGGQFVQERYSAAVIYLALQLGLGAWNILSYLDYQSAIENPSFETKQGLKTKLNTSAICFWASIGLGIMEAILIGIINPPLKKYTDYTKDGVGLSSSHWQTVDFLRRAKNKPHPRNGNTEALTMISMDWSF